MKSGIIYFFLAAILIVSANSCSKDNVYSRDNTGAPAPPSGDVITNITYGSNVNWMGQNQELKLDVYLPPTRTEGQKFPLILWVHGGGFLVGDKEAGGRFAVMMAERGFVTAPIDYRLGWTKSESNTCEGDSTEAKAAFYRAIQDSRAAIRYLVANADKYAIDTNWIFIGGASAGGVTSLSLPYFTEDAAKKYLGDSLFSALGTINETNTLTNSFKIKGIMSMWGAIGYIDLINSQNAVPTIFYHGTEDNVVPFATGNFYTCPNYPVGYGTKPVYDLLTSLGIPAVAHVEPGGGHGVFTDQFRADNSACFLNSVMTGKSTQKGYYLNEESSCP